MEHEVWQDAPKPARKKRIWVLVLLTAAVAVGSAMHLLDIPHVDVEKLPGAVQITIGRGGQAAPETPEEDSLLSAAAVEEARSRESVIGLTVEPVPVKVRIFYDLPEGLYVSKVAQDSDAAQKGLREGDVVTACNGENVSLPEELRDIRDRHAAGESVELTVFRAGNYEKFKILLMERSGS